MLTSRYRHGSPPTIAITIKMIIFNMVPPFRIHYIKKRILIERKRKVLNVILALRINSVKNVQKELPTAEDLD